MQERKWRIVLCLISGMFAAFAIHGFAIAAMFTGVGLYNEAGTLITEASFEAGAAIASALLSIRPEN